MLAAMALPSPAAVQLDPLLFLKLAAPNVIVAVDTAHRMQRSAPTDPANPQTSSSYYDPFIYQASLTSATVQVSSRVRKPASGALAPRSALAGSAP